MASDPNCIFCKIAAGQIPCFKVFEDDAVLAFLDIGPLVRGHTLVISKAHVATVMEMAPEAMATVMERVPAISRAVIGAVGAKACHVLVNSGAEAQQSVGHLHVHIIPRVPGDGFHIPWKAGTLDKAATAGLVEAIRAKL